MKRRVLIRHNDTTCDNLDGRFFFFNKTPNYVYHQRRRAFVKHENALHSQLQPAIQEKTTF